MSVKKQINKQVIIIKEGVPHIDIAVLEIISKIETKYSPDYFYAFYNEKNVQLGYVDDSGKLSDNFMFFDGDKTNISVAYFIVDSFLDFIKKNKVKIGLMKAKIQCLYSFFDGAIIKHCGKKVDIRKYLLDFIIPDYKDIQEEIQDKQEEIRKDKKTLKIFEDIINIINKNR